MKNSQPNKLMIRNSTAEFLMFTADSKQDGIEVRFEEETVWLSRKMIALLFDVDVNTIQEHLSNIYKNGELTKEATYRKFRLVQKEGSRSVKREIEHYNLDAIISVGYRVNSIRATQFRKWATQVLSEFAIKGYVLDRERLENGTYLGEDYYERLLEEIREIRISERKFYQKVTDIYATSIDYDKEASLTKDFFAKVQNKLHYATHKQTAAELIKNRANSQKANMGLTTWRKSPSGKILKSDVIVAKNYLTKEELDSLGRLVNAFLDLAERRAKKKIPMTMEDWSKRLDKFLELDDNEILVGKGSITADHAKVFAESEWEKYRVTQDRIFESDFDKELIKKLKIK